MSRMIDEDEANMSQHFQDNYNYLGTDIARQIYTHSSKINYHLCYAITS